MASWRHDIEWFLGNGLSFAIALMASSTAWHCERLRSRILARAVSSNDRTSSDSWRPDTFLGLVAKRKIHVTILFNWWKDENFDRKVGCVGPMAMTIQLVLTSGGFFMSAGNESGHWSCALTTLSTRVWVDEILGGLCWVPTWREATWEGALWWLTLGWLQMSSACVLEHSTSKIWSTSLSTQRLPEGRYSVVRLALTADVRQLALLKE